MKRSMMMMLTLLTTASGTTGFAHAAGGMWTLDNLPTGKMQSRYGFTPSSDWIAHVMHSSLRFGTGCSASFVSRDGLIMTNHHCAAGCLADLSTVHGGNPILDGFSAPRAGAEPRCPGLEVNQLTAITDVTDHVQQAVAGKTGDDFEHALHASEAAIEHDCAAGDPADTTCRVVELYHGGRYSLYRYRRYDDIRLVFAPDDAIANFGGDPDNFSFPRYDLDVTFLRAYEHDQPVHTDYFRFDPAGPKAGELVFLSGNPGSTVREDTAEQLEALRDVEFPLQLDVLSSVDGVAWEFGRGSAEQHREAVNTIYFTENSLKRLHGFIQALGNPTLIAQRRAADADLLGWIDADPTRKARYGDPFAAVRATIPAERALYPRYAMLEGHYAPYGFASRDFAIARTLVRAAAERSKPDADRLAEYRDANLPALEARLFSDGPIYPALETTTLAWSLLKLRQVLTADDPLIHDAFGRTAPEQLAASLIAGTHVNDLRVRHTLWNGGAAAIAHSTDPMIRFAAAVDTASRAIRTQWETEVEAPQTAATTAISKAMFARVGTALAPDATFSERLSYGDVRGWTTDGHTVPPFTDFGGLFRRTTGAPPFALTSTWRKAEPQLDPHTPFDFVSTDDAVGGNSGSPIIDRAGDVVGILFDGNLPSLAGDFIYDESNNRSVNVDTAAIIAALRHVYHLDWLANELVSPAAAPHD